MSEPVQVNLGENGGVIVLREKADATRIIESERGKWDWFFSLADRDGNFDALRNSIRNAWRDLENEVSAESSLDGMADKIKRRYIRGYAPGFFVFHSDNPFVAFARTQSKFNSEQNHQARPTADLRNAGLMLAYALEASISGQEEPARDRSKFEYFLWKFGIHDNRPEQFKVDTFLDQSRKEVCEELDRFHQKNEQIGHLLSDRQQAGIDQNNQHNELAAKHTKNMQEIEDAFRKRMAIEAPVKLWQTREQFHRDAANMWGKASAMAGVVMLCVLVLFATVMFSTPVEDIKTLPTAMQTPDFAAAIVTRTLVATASKFAVVSLLGAWFIRVLVRNYLSQTHLATDASERAAVIETFLAMNTDDKIRSLAILESKGFPMALERAFGRAADGLVKDDGMPPMAAAEWWKGSGK